MKWFLKKIEEGKVHRSVPPLSDWDIFLIQIYSMVKKEDGIDINSLKLIFDSRNISDPDIFYETSVILSRVFHYMR